MIEGGCLCRAVRYTVASDPRGARACWCRVCQYVGAGSGTVSVVFAADTLEVAGAVQWYAVAADSGTMMQRGFCPSCGTPLFSRTDARPRQIMIRAGTLDDPNLLGPQATLWTSSAPDWACIDAAIPNFPTQAPPPAR